MGIFRRKCFAYDKQDYQLQMNDILDVKISSLNPEVTALFNALHYGTMQVAQATAQTGGDLFYITGLQHRPRWKHRHSFVGESGCSGADFERSPFKVDMKVSELFTNYHLQVRLGGVRFSALGEFNRPGKHVVMQNQVTIFEAIALGGDLSLVANREEIPFDSTTSKWYENPQHQPVG